MSLKVEPPVPALIERLARLMRSTEHDLGLNPAQWEALRYLDRANRFSNSPRALASYLGATKGTVSQTLIALERKGLIRREARPGARRSLSLWLTPRGREKLKHDPWRQLTGDIAGMGPRSQRHLARSLAGLLERAVRRRSHLTFGQCRTCRYFGARQALRGADAPHRCLLLNLPLMEADSFKICVEHEPPGAKKLV
jgi:DNA-binding MarR family transcriptional regulator